MPYDQTLIETGDGILVHAAHGLIGSLTQFFTYSLYTHAGVAIWLGGRLYMAELNGGRNHLIPASQLADFDVYSRPEEISRESAEAAVLSMLAHPIDYGFISFPVIGLLNFLGIKLFVHWRKILVCSGYVVAIYEAAGWSERSRVISPQELAEQLVIKLCVRA